MLEIKSWMDEKSAAFFFESLTNFQILASRIVDLNSSWWNLIFILGICGSSLIGLIDFYITDGILVNQTP